MKQEVHYTDDFVIPSISTVIAEESKHLLATQAVLAQLNQVGTLMEAVPFASKLACSASCAAFKLLAYGMLDLKGVIDDSTPGFHHDVGPYATRKGH